MNVNNSDFQDFGLSQIEYEEFEDILEYDKYAAASTDALLPELKYDGVITEDILRRDIERVQKLRAEEVRWFYRNNSKKKWKAFIGSDSINIELEWRAISKSSNDIRRVCVRGGMYEVDVLERKCFPVYWSSFNLKGVEDSFEVTRGTWFYDGSFTPLDEELAEKIEQEHIERWKGISLEDVKHLIGNSIMHSVKLPHCHVDWNSVNDVYLHSDAVSYRALRNIVQKFGASKTSTSGTRLHRGYREDAMSEDCMPPVQHLVFVVHGIGAKPDRHKIVRNTDSFRLTCNRVAAKHFTHFVGRVEFVPVEWRSKLRLDDGTVNTVTPRKGQGMRQIINNNLMDIMYYTSPIYRGEIVDGLKMEIDQLHRMFLARNPDFMGKISIFAHSLGSVIMHDIMTGWSPESLFDEYLRKQYSEREKLVNSNSESEDSREKRRTLRETEMHLREMKIAKAKVARLEARMLPQKDSSKGLGFHVHNFFFVGSPLAIFLSLRGQRPGVGGGTQDEIIPRKVCNRIFNIFHPADPIAYRIEPLILSHYSSIAPLQIHWQNALNKTPYNEMLPRPYQSDATKEMVSVSSQGTGKDPDTISADLSDGEEGAGINALEELEEGAVSQAEINRRSTYLKSFSGGAFRVGKAIWSRARGSSQTNPNKKVEVISPDSSLVNEQELAEMNMEHSVNEGGSRSSSRSGSPAGKVSTPPHSSPNEVFRNNKTTEQEQTDSISSINLDHRLDYELQEGFTESKLGYASITSHTSYWTNQDVALFVLMQIHPTATMVQSMHAK